MEQKNSESNEPIGFPQEGLIAVLMTNNMTEDEAAEKAEVLAEARQHALIEEYLDRDEVIRGVKNRSSSMLSDTQRYSEEERAKIMSGLRPFGRGMVNNTLPENWADKHLPTEEPFNRGRMQLRRYPELAKAKSGLVLSMGRPLYSRFRDFFITYRHQIYWRCHSHLPNVPDPVPLPEIERTHLRFILNGFFRGWSTDVMEFFIFLEYIHRIETDHDEG